MRLRSFLSFLAALRVFYTLPFLLTVLIGAAPALNSRKLLPSVLLIALGGIIFGLFVNLYNDIADHHSGVDRLRYAHSTKSTLYWEGNPIDLGILSLPKAQTLLRIYVVLFALVLLPLMIQRGLVVAILALLALLLGYAYSGKPFCMDKRGYGELLTGTGFALLTASAALVLGQKASLEILLCSISSGTAAYSMRGIDALTGYPAHLAVGERDIGVRYGISRASRILSILIFIPALCSLLLGIHSSPLFLIIAFLAFSHAWILLQRIREEAGKDIKRPRHFLTAVQPAFALFSMNALGLITIRIFL